MTAYALLLTTHQVAEVEADTLAEAIELAERDSGARVLAGHQVDGTDDYS
jgi:hypothetical protein